MAWLAGYIVCLVSCRPATCEELTLQWLEHHSISYSHLLLRPVTIKHNAYKRNALSALNNFYKVTLAVDDNPEEIEMYKSAEVNTLYVHSGHWDESFQRRING